jgi:hypothetical protein
MGWTYSACGGEERRLQGFGGEISKKGSTWEIQARWEYSINMDLWEVACDNMTWIELAQDKDRRQAVVNEVMNIWVP